MKTLNEQIYEYLLHADAPVTAASLQCTEEFAQVPVMVLGRALLALASEKMAFYRAVDGKLCFSANPSYGKCATPAQDNLNQLSGGLNMLSMLGGNREKLKAQMLASYNKRFPEESTVHVDALENACFSGKRYSTAQYSIAFPDGAKVTICRDEKYDFMAELEDRSTGLTFEMDSQGTDFDHEMSKETGSFALQHILIKVANKLGRNVDLIRYEQDGVDVHVLLGCPTTMVMIALPSMLLNLKIYWTFEDGELPSKAVALGFIKAWVETFRYTGQRSYLVYKQLNTPEVLSQPLTEEHRQNISRWFKVRFSDVKRLVGEVYSEDELGDLDLASPTKHLIEVRSRLEYAAEKVEALLADAIGVVEHYERTEPHNPLVKRLYRILTNFVDLVQECEVNVVIPGSNLGPYNSPTDIVMNAGGNGICKIQEFPASAKRLLELLTVDTIKSLGMNDDSINRVCNARGKLEASLAEAERGYEHAGDFKMEGATLAAYFGDAKHVVIPDDVQAISSFAFKGCHELETVVLGENVRFIGFAAFDDCPKLQSITMNDALENVQGALTGFSLSKKKVKLIVYGDSYAHRFAKENKFPVELIKEDLTPLLTFEEGAQDLFDGLYVPRPDGFMSSVTHSTAFKRAKAADPDKKNIQYASIAEDTPNGFEGFYEASFSIRCAQDSVRVPDAVEQSKRAESVFSIPHVHDQYRTCMADNGKIVVKYDLVSKGFCELGNEYVYGIILFHEDCVHLFQIVIYGDSTPRQHDAAIKQWASRFVLRSTVKEEQRRKQKEEERKRKEEQRKREEAEKKEAERKRKEELAVLRPIAKAEADALRPQYDKAARMIACGFQHAVVLKADGTVLAKGNNSFGQCNVAGWRNIVAVAADSSGTVGLCRDGSVKYTGYTGHGANKCSRWKNIKEIVMTGDCVYGLTHDGRVLATAETKTGVQHSTALDVNTWSNIRTLRGNDSVILGITHNDTIESVRRNYYSRCESARMGKSASVEDVGLGYDGYGVVLHKDGSCSTWEKNRNSEPFLNDQVGIVRVYQIYGRSMALLRDGTLAYAPLDRRRDDFDSFMQRYEPKNIVAVAHSGSSVMLLTKDGRVIVQGFGSTYEISEGECFGEGFRLFNDLDSLLAEQEAAAERERIAREEAAERARQKKADAESKRMEKLYTDGCANAEKEEKSVGKRLFARKQARKQLGKISDYKDAAEYLPKLDAEIEELSKEHAAKMKKLVKRVCILAVVVALLVGGALATYHVVLPALRYNEAMEAMDNGDFETAYFTLLSLEEFDKDLNAYQDCDVRVPQAGCGYAIELAEAGRFEEALDMAKQYIYFAEGPEALEQCRFLYGVDLFEAGDYKAAIRQLEQCDTMEDAHRALDNCYRVYADVLYGEGKYTEAFKMNEKASDYDADDDRLRDHLLAHSEEALEAADYVTALEELKLLEGYKNADELMLRAKYLYVSDNKTADDKTTYAYLKELVEAEYEDAATIYEELYAWKIEISAINTNMLDAETSDKSLKRNQWFYVHVKISGGEPDGSTGFRYKVDWAGGGTDNKMVNDVKAGYWYQSMMCHGTGTFKFTLYDLDGNQLGSKSMRVYG